MYNWITLLHNLKQSEHHKSTIFQQYIFLKSTSVSTAEKVINAQILFTEHFRFSRSFQAHGWFIGFFIHFSNSECLSSDAWRIPSGQRSLTAYIPWGHKELDTVEWVSTAQAQSHLNRSTRDALLSPHHIHIVHSFSKNINSGPHSLWFEGADSHPRFILYGCFVCLARLNHTSQNFL